MPGWAGGGAASGTGRRPGGSRRKARAARANSTAAAAVDCRVSGAAARGRVQDGVVFGGGRRPAVAAQGAGVGDGSWCTAVGQASCRAARCMRCYTSRAAGDGHLKGWLGRESVGSSGGAVAGRTGRSRAPATGTQSRPIQLVFAVVVVSQQGRQQVHPQGRRRRSRGVWERRCCRRRTCFNYSAPTRAVAECRLSRQSEGGLGDDAANQPSGLDCSQSHARWEKAGGVLRLSQPSQCRAPCSAQWRGWTKDGWMGGRAWDWRTSRGRGGRWRG